MEEINVLITTAFPENLMVKLSAVSPRLNLIQHPAAKADELPEELSTIEVLYTFRALPDLEKAPSLRWVQLHSAGINQVTDHPIYTDSTIEITTTSGIHAVNMAEYVMGQLLALTHHIPPMVEDKARQIWPQDRWDRYVPRELRGMTLGIIGYGSIGREVARLANAFGMQVVAVKRDLRHLEDNSFRLDDSGDPSGDIPERIYPVEALASFLADCDAVVLTLPLTEDTYHLINADTLAQMRPGSFLINVSRGDVVDEVALLAALETKHIGGAALDVFQKEPLPADHALWQAPNIIISPHVAGFTPDYDVRAVDLFAENLRRFIVGEALINRVERKRGY